MSLDDVTDTTDTDATGPMTITLRNVEANDWDAPAATDWTPARRRFGKSRLEAHAGQRAKARKKNRAAEKRARQARRTNRR